MDYPVHGVSWTLLSILSFLTFSQCLNDGTPDVRDAAFSALAAIAKVSFYLFINFVLLLLNSEF